MYPNFSKPFKIALGFSFILALSLYLASYLHSRETVFLFLNTDLGKMGDLSFNAISYLAEGWIWIPYFMLVFGWFKKDALFILLNFLLSTILTQLPKNFIWDKVSRPMASGIPHDQIHTVKGVEMHLWNSFPSGHSATAFTLFLVTVYLYPKKEVLMIGALYAIACGYSRVYLGQHFPLDVAGGITVAIITILLSIYIRKNEKENLSIN
jgi:membrane-associated phospholipid phosphatase